MLVESLSPKVLPFTILVSIVLLIDNGHGERNRLQHYPLQFRAPHSPSYEYIYLPGRIRASRRHTPVGDVIRLGDILLGGFFPIHQPPSNELGSMQCTAIKRERGIQRLEAMLFALDAVNRRSTPLMSRILGRSKIRFGSLIYDSCDYESYAIERTLNMLLPSIDQCVPAVRQDQSSIVAGVIGSASSIVSMAIADILRLAEVSRERERKTVAH